MNVLRQETTMQMPRIMFTTRVPNLEFTDESESLLKQSYQFFYIFFLKYEFMTFLSKSKTHFEEYLMTKEKFPVDIILSDKVINIY